MNTNKQHFQAFKRETQLLDLRDEGTRRFLESSDFRAQVENAVEDSREQLMLWIVPDRSIHFENNVDKIRSIFFSSTGQKFTGAKQLNIFRFLIPDLPALCNVESIALHGCEIENINLFSKVVRLRLNGPEELNLFSLEINTLEEVFISGVTKLVNYQLLRQAKKVIICDCDSITDVTCFQAVRELNLDGCKNVAGVNSLGMVTSLGLSGCFGVKDVSRLSSCRQLFFGNCSKITDVSALGNVIQLSLSDCANIVDVSALGRVSILNLSGCSQVRDVSKLGNVKKLNLSNCPLIRDLSSLGSVYDLNLTQFQGTDISALKNVKTLNLSYSPYISDLSALGNSVETLIISYCNSISNITVLNQVRSLDITESLNIHDFSGLTFLQELKMSTTIGSDHAFVVSKGFETFQQLKNLRMGMVHNASDVLTELIKVKTLQVVNNKTSLDLAFATNLQAFEIQRCSQFQLIPSSLAHLLKVFIVNCPQVNHIPELPRLERLTIYDCDGLTSFTSVGNVEHAPIDEIDFNGCRNLKIIIVERRVTRLLVASTVRIQNSHLIRNISHEGMG
jgi:hypothetical protein